MTELYDTIGHGYERLRLPDRRIAAQLQRALGASVSVLNVGAGAGSYEPSGCDLVAVEVSQAMIAKRARGSAPVVRATAVDLPFQDDVFSASLAILTIHHWPDRSLGLRELRRVARDRVVILTWDPAAPGFWLTEYFPELLTIDREIFPTLDELRSELGDLSVHKVMIPEDCSDGFLGAYWKRPEAYLSPEVRAAISTFARVESLKLGLTQLRADLSSGQWTRQYGSACSGSVMDLGYRLIVAELR